MMNGSAFPSPLDCCFSRVTLLELFKLFFLAVVFGLCCVVFWWCFDGAQTQGVMHARQVLYH
jgi:hypothetical protein